MLLPEPIKRCAHALRRSARREDGFTIIEVLVSALLVAMSAIGVFAALDSASATSGRDKAKNVAAQLAESDQERLRSMSVTTINNLRETRTETIDGDVYTITSRADWVNDTSGTQSCSGSNTSFDYLKIRSTITWAGMGTATPVAADSLRSVPNGSFGTGQGSLAIEILNSSGTGVAGVPVSVSGSKNFTETTNSNGCIFIGFIPTGTYTVSFSKSGYVESKLPNRSSITDSVVVASESTSTQSYLYDQAGTASVKFQTTTTAPNGSTLANANGLSFSVGHTGLGLPSFKAFTRATASNTMTSDTPTPTKVVFPFTSAYSAWAGACSDANPTLAINGTQTAIALTVPPGGTNSPAPVNLRMPRLQVTVKNSSGTAISGTKVTVTPVLAGCSQSFTIAGGNALTTNASGVAAVALPYGDYSVCAQNAATSPVRRLVTTSADRAPGGSAYTMTLPSTNTTPAACP